MKCLQLLSLLIISTTCTQAQVSYSLTYLDSASGKVEINIELTQPLDSLVNFIMPVSVPGYYGVINYDRYVQQPLAITTTKQEYKLMKGYGPRWSLPMKVAPVKTIHYTVDIKKMEQQQLFATDYSLLRNGFAGILNYSVFGWIEGTENQPVQCYIKTFNNWKIYSTIQPKENPDKGSYSFSCNNYYQLADSQTWMGTAFQLKKFNGLVPVYVISYSEKVKEYLDDVGWQATTSINILKDYFDDIPFKHYTIARQVSSFPDSEHIGGFAMEHLNSITFGEDTSEAITTPLDSAMRLRSITGVLHHMGHAYLPMRCYGDGYVPYVKEIPPVIKNIWFNEGFMWFLCYDTLKSQRMLNFIKNNVHNADKVIKEMSLTELSTIGSTMYANDFRIGRALFSRGALMAYEIDSTIKSKTNDQKSMKDVYRYLYKWSKENKRAFTLDEFPQLLQNATGVELSAIYNKWMNQAE